MRVLRNVRFENCNLFRKEKARKIFSIAYENLTTFILYQDADNDYTLVVAKKDDPPLVLEKNITRAEAFRIMNTRP